MDATQNTEYSIDTCLEMLGKAYVPARYWDHKDMEYRFWFRTLFIDLCSVFEFSGLPENWPQNFFKLILFTRGFMAVFADKKLGLAFNPCAIREWNFYYQPRIATISNPYYPDGSYYHEYEIGETCELLKLNEDYLGIIDHIDYFCQKLSNISVAINMAMATAKIPAVFQANTENEKSAIEMIWDDSQSGKPITIVKNPESSNQIFPSKDLVSVVFAELKKNYIGTELLADLQTTLDMWYSFIGYPTTVDKNAHILNQEADFQFAQSAAKVKTWTNCMNRDFKKINKMFGTNMEVKYACEDMSSRNAEVSSESEQEHK